VIVLKKLQILIAIAFIFSIISSSTFAVQTINNVEQPGATEQDAGFFKDNHKHDKCEKDPIKRLEERKNDIEKEYKEGKITKEKADELTKRIDERIVKIKKFNSLTLPEKKEHLNKKFKSHIEQNVKKGNMTKEEGDKAIQEFNKQLENWDGDDFPKFKGKSERHR
jgi:polyhydroxyalkanoate synthesis regulator phasin